MTSEASYRRTRFFEEPPATSSSNGSNSRDESSPVHYSAWRWLHADQAVRLAHAPDQSGNPDVSGNPNGPTEPGLGEGVTKLDQSLEISMHDDIYGTAVKVAGKRPAADVTPQQDWYDAILTGNASWSNERPDGCVILEDDPTGRTLRCINPFDNTYSGSSFDGDERVFFHLLYLDTPTDAELRIEVTYGAIEADQTPSDNRASVGISHLENPPATSEVEAPIAILTHPDEPATLRILLIQPADAFPRDAQLVVELPYQVVVTAAQAVRRTNQYRVDDTVVDCEITDTVICAVSAIKPDISYAVELQLLATAQTAAPIRLTLTNVDLDAGDPIVQRDIHIEQVRSMAIIQALLENAEAGSTVTLQPGVFGGALDGRGKRLNVIGAEGCEPTVLLTGVDAPLIAAVGPRSTWSRLVLRSYGVPILGGVGANFTLADSLIEPAHPDIHDLHDELVVAHSAASWRLLNNTIRDWGSSASGTCNRLLEITTHSAAVYLQRNVFAHNNCVALIDSILHPGSSFTGYDDVWLIATNNTLVDNLTLIRLAGEPDERRSLEFRNNIVVGSDTLFDISDMVLTSSNQVNSKPWLLTS